MALSKLKLIKSDDTELMGLQGNVREFINQLNEETLSGRILKDVVIGTSTTLVSHLLGRGYQGWHLLDIRGDSRVWRDATSTADNELFLPLVASSSVTVNLWVF